MMPGLAFIFGLFAAAAALLVQVFVSLFISSPLTGPPSLLLLIGAAGIEEGAKLLFLIQFGRRLSTSVSLGQATLFGVGFIATEFFLLNFFAAGRMPDPLALAGIASIHLIAVFILYGGLRLRTIYSLSPFFALLLATLLHILYNASL